MKHANILLIAFGLLFIGEQSSARYLLVEVEDGPEDGFGPVILPGQLEGAPENDGNDTPIPISGRGCRWCHPRCFEEDTLVWTKNEAQADEDAKQIPIKNLKEGNLVRTMTPELPPGKDQNVMVWTRATDVTVYNGDWMVHKLTFNTGDHLTVTSPHMMIIWPNSLPHFVRADQVKIGDMMRVRQTIEQITEITTFMVDAKVSVETEDGTIQANDVLTSGFCDENPDMLNRTMEAFGALKIYKDQHFTPCYSGMCMDSVAWNNSFMLNNGLFLMEHTQY